MKTIETLSQSESEALLTCLITEQNSDKRTWRGVRNFLIAKLMLDTGIRVGELVQLKVSDLVHLDEIVHSLVIRPEIAKNKIERCVPLTTSLINALSMAQCQLWYSAFPKNEIPAFYTRNEHTAITVRQVERIIRTHAEITLNRPIHPHVLRHTFATRLMRTTNIRIVQQLLGHKQLTSTQVYTHPNNLDLQAAISTLDT